MTSATSGPSAADFSRALLLGSIQTQYDQRARTEIERITERHGVDIGAAERERTRWQRHKTDLGSARNLLEDTTRRLQAIQRSLDVLSETIVQAERDPEIATGSAGYATVFDNHLDAIRSSAENARYDPNLLGNITGYTFSFDVNLTGRSHTVHGGYVGTTYEFRDAGDKTWVPDHRANLLQQYDDYPTEESGLRATTAGGVELDALSGTSATITLGRETAAALTVSGTIEAKGLALLDAWSYQNLADADGRSRALSDIAFARQTLNLERSRYELALSVVDRSERRADAAIERTTQERLGLIRERERAKQVAQAQIQSQLSMVANSLSHAEGLYRSYRNMFGQYSTLPGSFNRVVGTTSAARVFSSILNIRA